MLRTMRMGQGEDSVAAGPDVEGDASAPVASQYPTRARRCPACTKPFSGEARFCPYDGDPLVDAPDWNPAADALIGQTIEGRYKVEAVLGEGGMGTVYEVRHVTLGRPFAMKVLRRDVTNDSVLTARFIQEAKIAAGLGHPNIVAVTDFGELALARSDGGTAPAPFFVMEYLTGESLAALLKRERILEAHRAAKIFTQCASALSAAHQAGVIHRDLKPDNIFLTKAAEREFVKILDFGVAKMAGVGRLTTTGMVYGTPYYMSPEQAAGRPCDARADIYALGVIMYECFAGHVPFEADSYMGVLTKHMVAVPIPFDRAAPNPEGLGALGPITMRCLSKEPEDRFATMDDVVRAIEAALADPAGASLRPPPVESPPRSPRLRLRERNPPAPLPDSSPRVRPSEPPEIPGLEKAPLRRALAGVALGLFAIVAFGVWRSRTPPSPAAAGAAPLVIAAQPVTAPPAPPDPTPSSIAPALEASSASPPVAPPAASSAARPPPRAASMAPSSGRKPLKRKGEVVDPWGD